MGFKHLKYWHKQVRSIFLLLSLIYCSEISFGQFYPEPIAGTLAGQATDHSSSPEPGLLFYLSGENQYTADYASGGQKNPNFLRSVDIIPDGAVGNAFEAGDDQLMSYWAPGNIYAQRGTLSFFWRSRYPVGKTPFPVFRVGYADHTSWDMVWLRIDYNGSGFDAFVTDIGLARTRVSYFTDDFPAPDQWTHIAFSWDETEGVRFYINGELVKQQSREGKVFDAALDQFGPHSRIISPYQVQSAYNFMRGGDLDELRIYDRMLSEDNIKDLSQGKAPNLIPTLKRDLGERIWRDEWWDRFGWNLPNEPPPLLTSGNVIVRKIGIHEAYDVKRWSWKALDGIRETTWPGVYNMSRLPGRYDYFVLPDWDCYSMSGQSIKFILPDEPWNHVEIWGKAWGQLTLENEHDYDFTFAVRNKEQVKSYHRIDRQFKGGTIRFDNALIEEPIGELGVYYVHEGMPPTGLKEETFMLHSATGNLQNRSTKAVYAYILGRHPADEQSIMIGNSIGQLPSPAPEDKTKSLPFIHILIPYNNVEDKGLDGVKVELPALPVKPTHKDIYPLNIRIKDPLWPIRDLADFSFSIKPNTPYTLWIDTRDRILPEDHALYITVAGAGAGLTPEAMNGAKITLVYKSKEDAAPEHELDRFTQIRDLYSHIVEEHPSSSRLNLYNRLYGDLADLLRVNPGHWLGKAYNYAVTGKIADRPAYIIPESPAGVPRWAFLQTEYLKQVERIISYYINKRQISNGEFGGGLSDDDDFSNFLVGSALMGIEPEKIKKSMQLLIEGYYDQDRDTYDASLRQRSLPLFTNGLSTITADELHSYEEGVEAVGQLMMIDYGNPLYINRGMEIAKRMLNDVTQIAPDGHRHFRSRYYSGTDFSTDDPWQWSQSSSYLVLQAAYMIARYNGNPSLRQMIIEIADGLLAHMDEDGNMYTEINFATGEVRGQTGTGRAWNVFSAAYEFTGDSKYMEVIPDKIRKSREFNKEALIDFYSNQIKEKAVRQYIETDGSIWIDRITRDDPLIQEHRLGGVALIRANYILPGNHLSWNIHHPDSYNSVAFFVPNADSEHIKIIAYNLEEHEVHAEMPLWNVKPGSWQIVQGTDNDEDEKIDAEMTDRKVYLERGKALTLSFPARKYTIVELSLKEQSETSYWDRPDLAIGFSDIKHKKDEVTVRVYNLGAVDSPATFIELRDSNGELIEKTTIPSLKAPLDLIPKWTELNIPIPEGVDLSSGSLEIDPDHSITEITLRNNKAEW